MVWLPFFVLALWLPRWGAAAGNGPTQQQPAVFSPNPPACAAEFASFIGDATDLFTGVVYDTTICARDLGWYGNTIYGDKRVGFFHHQQTCAQDILIQLAKSAESASDMLAAAFDCFNDNQACGQSIVSAIDWFLEGGASLVFAAKVCPPQYRSYPYLFNGDPPVNGFLCWQKIWRFIQRVLKAAKYIDTAISSCELVAPEPFASPLPQGAGGPAPEAVAGPVPDPSGGQPAPQAREAAPAGPDEASGLGAAWDQLTQPQPFAPLGEQIKVEPAERRLAVAGNGGDSGGTEDDGGTALLARIQQLRAMALDRSQHSGWDLEEYRDDEVDEEFTKTAHALASAPAEEDTAQGWVGV